MERRTLPIVLLLVLGIIFGNGILGVHPARASPVWGVNLDANSITQTDSVVSSFASQGKSFRIGAIINATFANPISNMYGWQFQINYNASAFIPQGDPT